MNNLSDNFLYSCQLSFFQNFPGYKDYIYNSAEPLQICLTASKEANCLKESIRRIAHCMDFFNLYSTNKRLNKERFRGMGSGSQLDGLRISVIISTILTAYKNCIEYQNAQLDSKYNYSKRICDSLSLLKKAKVIIHATNIDYKIYNIWMGNWQICGDHQLSYGNNFSERFADNSTWLINAFFGPHEPPSEIIEKFIKGGAPLNAQESFWGNTALITACFRNFTSSCELLIKSKDIDLSIENYQGWTALNLISIKHNPNLLYSLIQAKADINQLNKFQETALHKACLFKNIQTIQTLILANANINSSGMKGSALHQAIRANSLEIVNLLIQANVNIESVDQINQTPLQYSCAYGNLTIFNRLVDENANVNHFNSKGNSIFIVACRVNNLEIVNQLISAKVNLNHQNNKGENALMVGVASNQLPIVERLIQANADIHQVDNVKNENALMLACQHNRAQIATTLIQANAQINHRNIYGASALTQACHSRAFEIASQLIQLNANVNFFGKIHRNSTLLVAISQHCDERIIPLLLEAKAEINHQNTAGQTALMYAIKYEKISIINSLIKANANVDIRDIGGKSALDYAREKGHPDLNLMLRLTHLSNDPTIRPNLAPSSQVNSNNIHIEKKQRAYAL